MRRAASGWEADGVGGDIRATWSSETVGASWAAVVDAASLRTGGYGFHCTRTASASNQTTAAYQSITLNTGNPRWTTAPDASTTSTPFAGIGAGDPRRAWLRVYHKPVTIGAGGNGFLVLQLANSANTDMASIRLTAAGEYRLTLSAADKGIIYSGVSAGTWYRLELVFEIDSAVGATDAWCHATGWVYTATGTTPLGMFSAVSTTTVNVETSSVNRINVGYRPFLLVGSAAHEGYLDDFAVNDELVAAGQSGVHVVSPWGGACRGLAVPTGAGTNAGWTIGGSAAAATNWQGVDEWVYDDGVTLNYTPAAVGTPKDSHHITNPTIPGTEVVKSASVICRAQDLAGGYPYYKMGLLENATDLEVNNNQTGGWFHSCAAVGEVGGGGAWTNAKANGAEAMYRKTTSDATAQQEVSSIVVEWEDDDGMGAAPAAPVYQRKRGWEA